MKTVGRRICIAGSASAEADEKLLASAHGFVSRITRRFLREGASVVIAVGKEPRLANASRPWPLVFDWTVLESVWLEGSRQLGSRRKAGRPLVCTIGTRKTPAQIPEGRRALWKDLVRTGLADMRYLKSGWTAGTLRRQIQADLSDVLIAIGGGQGVEHLAAEFAAQQKPVIPLDIQIGASCGDGDGAPGLFRTLRGEPEKLLQIRHRDRIGAIVNRMETSSGGVRVQPLVVAVLDLLREVDPPRAFYVRLLNTEVPEFPAVERFFRECVDPVVRNFGFLPAEMGRTKSTGPWMNMEIFKSVHFAGAVIVDLTGLRQNCFMELGYAFGRNRRVIVTARKPTEIPFDARAIEAFLWSESIPWPAQRKGFKRHWERNIQRGPLVGSQ
jgi:hypothetical protein